MNAQRTVVFPVAPDGSWALAWSAKYQTDVLPYQVDCTAWLADGGFTVTGVDVSASPNLTVSQLTNSLSAASAPKLISLVLGGGVGGTTAQIGISLTLAGGYGKYVLVSLPILQTATGLVSQAPVSGSTGSANLTASTLLTVVL